MILQFKKMYLELGLLNYLFKKKGDSICFLFFSFPFWATKNYFANGANVYECYYKSKRRGLSYFIYFAEQIIIQYRKC